MSVTEIISNWKQKSEVDYFALLVPLWLAFDAWCKDKYGHPIQRNCIEALKVDYVNNRTYQKITSLLQGSDSLSETFKDYLTQLHQALLAKPMPYEKHSNRILSFENAMTLREETPNDCIFENLMRTSRQHNKIQLIPGTFIADDIEKIYRSYIEILYDVRCKLFHGDLAPDRENERIVKYLYLTLKELMEEI